MTDDQLRALVRDAITRHVAEAASRPPAGGPTPVAATPLAPTLPLAPIPQVAVTAHASGGVAIAIGPGSHVQLHVSHATFDLPTLSDGVGDGPCHVEPGATCNRCGFCQSYGH
jgi:hypothetical protein